MTRIETRAGPAITPLLTELATLRTDVFRAWPYLYDGDPAYEQDYLRAYANSPRAMLAVAYDDATVIGAATCMPMADAAPEIQAPIRAAGWDAALFFYFGESVLLPEYRGQGLGVGFFTAREAHAVADGACHYALFYAVRRADSHPSRPADAPSLHGFWRRRGFAPLPGISCTMQWKEVGTAAQVTNTLDAWVKPLRPNPVYGDLRA